jgi:hypothetical protein
MGRISFELTMGVEIALWLTRRKGVLALWRRTAMLERP